MITFSNNPSAGTIASLLIVLTCALTSLLLNPVVFLYSKGKKSVASLMFCVLSSLDFIMCLFWPGAILFYAVGFSSDSIPENMSCTDPQSYPVNCTMPADITHILITMVFFFLIASTITTTAVMNSVRYIQIRHPFRMVSRKTVACVQILLLIINVVDISILMFSGDATYYPAFYTAAVINPFNISFESPTTDIAVKMLLKDKYYICIEIVAIISTILTMVHIGKTVEICSTRRQNKRLGSIKILLTNSANFVLIGIIVLIPVVYISDTADKTFTESEPPIMSEKTAWTLFFTGCLSPLLPSVWNPIIFITFSPKCRTFVREVLSRCWNALKNLSL